MPSTSRLQLLRSTDYKLTPWKNAGGITAEIAVHPSESTTDTFQWRLSLATVASSGPFSAFPGIDRIITLTEGMPIELDHGAHGRHVLQPLVPHAFDGAWTTSASLLGEGTRQDFNLMVRRSYGRGQVRVLRLAAEEQLELEVHSAQKAWYVCSGLLQFRGPDGNVCSAAASDTILAPHGAHGVLTAEKASIVLEISITAGAQPEG